MSEALKLFESLGGDLIEAEKSQMFGKPCFKIKGKAFVCFFQDEMVFKLSGEDHSKALTLDGAKFFDPSGKGRAMKEWVQVPFLYAENWSNLTKSAHNYVIEKYKL